MGLALRAFWFLCALTLAACSGQLPFENTTSQQPATGGFLTHTKVGDIEIAAPQGYCIDPRSNARNVRLVATCSSLYQAFSGPHATAAVMTVSITKPNSQTPLPTAADIVQSTGLPQIGNQTRNGLVMVHLEGGSDRAFAAADTRQWRGFFALGDYHIGLSLYAEIGSPLAASAGADMLLNLKSGVTLAKTQ